MQTVYAAVTGADTAATSEDAIAEVLDDADADQVEQLVASMLVSGYLKRERHAGLVAGPTPMPATPPPVPPGGRRPRHVPAQGGPLPDKLRLGARRHPIPLGEGEALAGSVRLNDGDGGLACMAGVATPAGPTVRVGLPLSDEEKGRWNGTVKPQGDRDDDVDEDDDDPVDEDLPTVVLDDAGVDALDDAVCKAIVAGEQAKADLARLERDWDLARDARFAAEAMRFDPDAAGMRNPRPSDVKDAAAGWAEDLANADWQIRNEARYQRERAQHMRDEAADVLDHDSEYGRVLRARYEQLERDYQALDDAGDDGGEPVWARRRRIRGKQANIVTPLSEDDVLELFRLDDQPLSKMPYPEAQRVNERIDRIMGSAGEKRFGGGYLQWMLTHDLGATDLDKARAEREQLERYAKPVDEQTQALIDAARVRHATAEDAYDAAAGETVARYAIPGQGGALVVEVVQGEDGGPPHYLMDTCPAGEDPATWDTGTFCDPWTPKPAQLRKLAATTRALRDGARLPGQRPRPSGVPFATATS